MSNSKAIYKGMTRQDIIDNLVQSRFDNMEDDILFDILEHGHTGYSEYDDDGLIEEYQELFEDDEEETDDYSWVVPPRSLDMVNRLNGLDNDAT